MYAYFDVCTHVCNGVDDSAKSYIYLLDNYTIFPHNVGYYVNNIYLVMKLKQIFHAICNKNMKHPKLLDIPLILARPRTQQPATVVSDMSQLSWWVY